MYDVHDEIFQPVICEDQIFDISYYESERSQEKQSISKKSMPNLFSHEKKIKDFIVYHHLEYVFLCF